MDNWDYLKEILKYSVKVDGNKTLTTKHLLAMMDMADKKVDRDERRYDLMGNKYEIGN